MRRLIAVLAVVCLLAPTVTAASLTAIDTNHGLTSDTAKVNFEQDGYATTDLIAPNMSISIASELSQCGVEDWTVSDLRNDFLCVEYGEAIDRSIRLHIPEEYWHPYVREEVKPVTGNAVASYEPVQDGEYTAVEFTVTSPATLVWPINADSSWFSARKDSTIEDIESVTGVGVANEGEWQQATLSGNGSGYVVRAPNGTAELTVEYRTEDGSWVTVPDSEEDYAPVFRQGYDGVDDRTLIVSTVADPPPIRYQTDATTTDQLASGWRELTRIDDRIEEMLNIDIPFVGSEEDR